MPCSLRIGVNALYLIPGGVGGTEIYLRNLLAALAEIDRLDEYYVFINAEAAEAKPALAPATPNFHTVVCPLRAVHRPARLLWEQLALPVQAAGRRLDVLFCPGYTSPLWSGARKVAVIHDLQHIRQPENFGRLERAAWRALVWLSARFSRTIVTVSENSRREILEVYGVPGSRVRVVQHGVEPAFFSLQQDPRLDRDLLGRAGLGEWPYLLSVSTIHAHKNWGRWLEAYGLLVGQGLPHHLVIAGIKGKYWEELARRVQAGGLSERVHVVGWAERSLLLALFKFAQILVFPSTIEGFGLPVLEAMAAGVPVACSDIAPLRELAGPAALYFDPHSPEAMAAAVQRLVSKPPLSAQLAEMGRQRAGEFTWMRSAQATLEALREAAQD